MNQTGKQIWLKKKKVNSSESSIPNRPGPHESTAGLQPAQHREEERRWARGARAQPHAARIKDRAGVEILLTAHPQSHVKSEDQGTPSPKGYVTTTQKALNCGGNRVCQRHHHPLHLKPVNLAATTAGTDRYAR